MHRTNRPARWLLAPVVVATAALAACALVARGQVPATRPAAAATGLAAATQPATTQPAGAGVKITLNFKDAPLDTVLDYLSQQIGFAIIKEGPLDGRVTIVSKQPVSTEEALTLVNAALKVNGFTAIREDRLLRIAPRDKAKKGNVPVRFGSDPKDIPSTDEMVTQVIPILNMGASKLKEDLKPLMGTDGDVAANDASNSIIITDSSASIRRVVQIINALDQHEASTAEIRIIPLKYANAAAAVKLIDTFFKNAGGGGGPPQMTPEMQMRMQQGQPVQMPRAGGDKHGQNVVAAADDRTNVVIVQGSSAQLKAIEGILEKLDSNPMPASVMRTYQLKFAQAEATAKLINTLFKAPKSANDDYPFFYRRFGGGDDTAKNPQVNAVFDERTNTLIVTAPADQLKNVEEMVKLLDASPMAASDLKVYQLKYADAYTVAKLIEDMFKPKDDSGPRFPFFIFSDNPAPAQSKGIKVNVTSDDRTNSLLVSAPTELLKVIEGIIKELDANPASEDTLFIYHLRNGQSANLEYVLNVLFGNVNSPNQQNGQNGQNPNGNPDQQQNRNNSRFSSSATGNNRTSNSDRSTSGTRRDNRQQNRAGMPRLSPGMASAVNALTGKVFVVADQDTNALIVTTASKYERQVRAIIDDLDRPVPQVLIKVLVAEVTHANSADLGVDFSVLNTRPSGNGQTLGTNFGNAAVKGGLVVSVIETNISATLHALAEQDKLDVLSRPYLLASDNQLANILIGQQVPFITDTRITDNGQQINTIQYRDIGLSLDVTPHINPDGVVILDVTPEISQLTSQTVPISSTTSAPIIATRRAESRIGVKDGQTIVIGGLMEDRKTSSVQKVPLLGDIPYLGLLLSRTQVTKTKTELLIFLTPHVAQRPETLEPSSEEETQNLKLAPEAVQPGTFDEHMRALKRGKSDVPPSTQPISPINSIDLSPPDKRPAPAEGANPTPSTGPQDER